MLEGYKHKYLKKAICIVVSFALVMGCGFPSTTATAIARSNQSSEQTQAQTQDDNTQKSETDAKESKSDDTKGDESAETGKQDQGGKSTEKSDETGKDSEETKDSSKTTEETKEKSEKSEEAKNSTESKESKKNNNEASAEKDKKDEKYNDDQTAALATIASEETKEVAGPAAVYVPFAVYSATDYSLRIYNRGDPVPTVGSTYNGRAVTAVVSNFDGRASGNPAWVTASWKNSVKMFIVEDSYQPTNSTDLTGFAAGLTYMTYADVTNIDTSSATTVVNFFCDDSSLQTVKGTHKWDTSNVTNIQGFAARCVSLKQLNLSSWNTKKVTQAYCAFGTDNSSQTCAISHIFVGDNFDLSNVTYSACLFGGDTKLPNYASSVAYVNQDITYAKQSSSSGYLEKTVCKIEPTSSTAAPLYQSSLIGAIDAAVNGSTITVFKDNTTSTAGNFSIEGRNITLRNETSDGFDWTGSSAVTYWSGGDVRWTITGSGTMTLDGVIFDGTSYNHGNPYIIIYTGSPTLNIKGDTELRNHTAGSAIQFLNTSGTCNMSGGKIYNNLLGFHIITGSTSAKLNISGGTIQNNSGTSSIAGGVRFADSCTIGAIKISGNPTIQNNSTNGTTANVQTSGASIMQIDDLTEGANVGVYSTDNYTTGKQFATGVKSAKTIAKLTGNVSNDRDASLEALAGTGTAIVWGKPTCKIVSGSNEGHFSDLPAAIAAASSGDTIEIYKSHTVNSAMDTSGKNITIRNITDPANDDEDPRKNGSADEQPVITFGTSTQLQVKSTVTIGGIIFDGGTNTSRTISGISVSSGSTLNIVDGEQGTLAKTETTLKSFVNTSTASMTSGGGLFSVSGIVNMSAGKITGCYSYASGWTGGGGDVASIIASTGEFNLSGGEVSNNGRPDSRSFCNSPFLVNYGKFNMTGGKISDNVASCGGAIAAGDQCNSVEVNITSGEICNNTADRQGGAVFIGAHPTGGYSGRCKVGGDAYIHDNKTLVNNASAGAGSAICVFYANAKCVIEGSPRITGNTSTYASQFGAAITGSSSTGAGTISISGTPYIRGNTDGSGSEANVCTWEASKLTVSDLGSTANIGFYNSTGLCNEGSQFATGTKTASTINNLTSSFVNDKNSNLLAMSGSGTAIVWGIPTCKLVKSTGETHYGNLSDAIAAATSGATDERIEIYKSHTVSASMDTSNKPLTIMNITDPKNDEEDPTKNGSTDSKPVITFAAGGRLVVNSDVVLKGVVFDGASTTRATSAIAITTGNTLTIKDGEGGELSATSTVLSNFYNATSSNDNGGGCLNVAGTANIESGTITGCKSESASSGGGAAALINGGTLNFNGGTIKGNGEYKSGGAEIGAISSWGGTFNMTGGTATDNKGSHGGFYSCEASSTNVVNITGGQIINNSCFYDGGALYFSTNVTATIGGDVVIAKNYADRSGSAIAARAGATVTVTGNALITKNSCGSLDSSRAQGAICCLHYGSRPHIIVSGNPVIKYNTNASGAECNVNLGYSADLEVGVLGAGALIGYYSENGTQSAGSQFAYSNQSSSAESGYLNTFVNDRYPTLLGTNGGSTAIKWSSSTNANVKIAEKRNVGSGTDYEQEVTFIHLFETLEQAFSCANELSADNVVDGAYTAEVLVGSLTHSAQAKLATGSAKPVVLTTASSSATDGYAYRGGSSDDAVINRAYNGPSMISVSAGEDGSVSNLTVKNITLNGNLATYSCSGSGGAISSLHAIVKLMGSTLIRYNKADGFSAIEIGAGESASSSDDQLFISESADIKDNVNSASTPAEKSGAVGTCNDAKVILSKSVTIYNNKDNSGNQQNLFDGTAKNDGSNIYVAAGGIDNVAKIGVTSINNNKGGDIFAHTETSPSEGYSNLTVFLNDKSSGMKATAATGDGIKWQGDVPVTIEKTIPQAQDSEVWFVIKVRRTSDMAEYRQAIKIEAGQTKCQATIVLSAGEAYDFIDLDSQGTWRFAADTTTTSDLAENDVWTLGGESDDYIGRLEINPDDNDTHNRTITFATKLVDNKYASSSTSVVNTLS